MHVSIDPDKCHGHGVCCVNAPKVYDIGDDGFAFVTSEEVPPGMEEDARMGAENCPERAITIQ
jgi:ferredoxin